jgi:hypothetical protein
LSHTWSLKLSSTTYFEIWTSKKSRFSYLEQGFSSETFYKTLWKYRFIGRRRRKLQATSRRMMIVQTAKISVGSSKNFSFNILLISEGKLSNLLNLVWRYFYYIMENIFLH